MASATEASSLPTLTPTGPRALELPALPISTTITETQWTTLFSIMDAAIPSLRLSTSPQPLSETAALNQLPYSQTEYNAAVEFMGRAGKVDKAKEETLTRFLEESPSGIPLFVETVKRTVLCYVRDKERGELGGLLGMLNNRATSLLLTGTTTPFHALPLSSRQRILGAWRLSYLPSLASAYKTLTFLAKNIYIKTSPTFSTLVGFPRFPTTWKPTEAFPYAFLQIPPPSSTSKPAEPEIIDTEVLIIGSGCGGSVMAANLSKAGMKVLVVDKGYYHAPETLPMPEVAGGVHLFDNGGFTSVDDSSMSIIAGSTWGGGGTINWSASLQPQYQVRREWAVDRGLSFFQSSEFQNCLDTVCARMGVDDKQIRHNHGNRALMEGSRRLGMTCKAVPQNTGGEEHYCGHCALGCGLGGKGKQGPAMSWLVDAAEAGATFMEGFEVEKVLFEDVKGKKTAVGAKGVWRSRDEHAGVAGEGTLRNIIVRAKKVIVSAGTLWSPIVLLNSGLKNPQIGANLYLHPVNIVIGIYPTPTSPWEGGILTTVTTTLEDLDTHFHGTKLECTAMLPSWILTFLNWSPSFKSLALKYAHTNGFIAIARDRDTGRVYPDPVSRKPRVAYTPSAFDRAHCLKGALALAKIVLASGAEEIHVAIDGVPPYIVSGVEDESTSPAFLSWLAQIEKIGNKPPAGTFACAHQMGSNRMSVRERDGVVDEQGKVWGVEGLWVADASIFPSASGVNPMVTNMGICEWLSRGMAREEREGRGGRAML